LLGYGTLRYNGKNALLGIQQVHSEITDYLWKNCYEANLVKSGIHIINREDRKLVYSFQTLTLPYFSDLHSEWYHVINGKRFKKLPNNIKDLFTDRVAFALAMFVMMDGTKLIYFYYLLILRETIKIINIASRLTVTGIPLLKNSFQSSSVQLRISNQDRKNFILPEELKIF